MLNHDCCNLVSLRFLTHAQFSDKTFEWRCCLAGRKSRIFNIIANLNIMSVASVPVHVKVLTLLVVYFASASVQYVHSEAARQSGIEALSEVVAPAPFVPRANVDDNTNRHSCP